MTKDVTVTMTTCKRLHLFKKTIASLLEMCEDQDRIAEWIVSDDHSPKEQVAAMKKLYPFMNVLSSSEKGHAANLNNVFKHVKTPYVLHLEDDWRFIKKGKFISKGIHIIKNTTRIKIVVLKPGMGDIPKIIKGESCLIHLWDKDENKGKFDYKKAKCKQFGHYTLNPSIQSMDAVRKTGRFKKPPNTEGQFTGTFSNHGFKLATLPHQYVEHIGTGAKNSAYILNKTRR